MVLRVFQLGAVAAAIVVAVILLSATPQANAQSPAYYNYYVAPTGVCLGATLYPCPRPTPPLVGHTYITYQGLNPHEFLYPHRRTYFTYHPSGTTVTMISWR